MNTQMPDTKKVKTRERRAVTLRIDKTNINKAEFFTRVLEYGDGREDRYEAEVLPAHANGILLNPHIKNQIHIKIHPGERQLKQIVNALNDGRLAIRDLARLGGNYGGKSELYIPA